MIRQPTTRLHLSGYRFLMRRMELALVRGDARTADDPIRAQSLSLIAGCVLTAIAVAACAVLAFLHPRGTLDTPIVMVRETGALYVRLGDTMHPALNMASARLLTGFGGAPGRVSAAVIDRAQRGPTVGIAGAPEIIAAPLDEHESNWAVCDHAATTAVVVGAPMHGFDDTQQAFVTPAGESAATTYLVYDGRRAKVDVRNPAVVRALKLDGRTPRPVSRALLDALPEVPAIALPAIAGAGAPSVVRGLSVGTVFRSIRADTTEYYVALTFGVQRIGQVAADLIRFAQPGGTAQLVTVAPSVIGGLPIIEELPVSTFPDRSAVTDRSALCAQWTPGGKTAVLTGDSLPVMPSVSLAQADGDGPDVDSVRIPPGRSAYIRAVGVSGAGAGFRFLVTDAGVVFGIHDDDAATRLGLTEPPRPAPWPVLARLPRGPELSVQAASVVRDSVGSPS